MINTINLYAFSVLLGLLPTMLFGYGINTPEWWINMVVLVAAQEVRTAERIKSRKKDNG